MSLRARSESVAGTLKQRVLVDGRHVLETDEPVEAGGDGSAPAPHELLPAAIAACVSTTVVMYARTRDWPLEAVSCDVEYDHRSTPRTVDISLEIDGDLTADQVERLERVAASCPVRRSIESGIEFRETVTQR
ncbi:MAG TPA: OsmC family protein [Gaiellaceae bacterium]